METVTPQATDESLPTIVDLMYRLASHLEGRLMMTQYPISKLTKEEVEQMIAIVIETGGKIEDIINKNKLKRVPCINNITTIQQMAGRFNVLGRRIMDENREKITPLIKNLIEIDKKLMTL